MSLVKNKESFDTKTWICAILLFIISFPKFVWGMGANVMLFAQFLLFFICLSDIKNNKQNGTCIAAFCIQAVFVWIYSFTDALNLYGVILSVFNGLSFVTIFFCSPKFWRSCIDCFIRILSFLLLFSLIEHILISYFELDIPYTIIDECPINPGRSYFSYIFNVHLEGWSTYFSRFCAFYDEPGVLGNIVLVLLFLQKFDLKKWYNIILLISGLLSFSLTFYIGLCAFYIISGSARTKISFSIIAAILIYLLAGNEYIDRYLFGRLAIEDGSLVGYNREQMEFDTFFDSLNLSDYLFFGYSPRSEIVYAASWKWALVLYGVIPSVLYFLLTQLRNLRSLPHKEDLFKAIVLAVIIWIQRPFIHLYIYALLFVIPSIYYLAGDDVKINNEES